MFEKTNKQNEITIQGNRGSMFIKEIDDYACDGKQT